MEQKDYILREIEKTREFISLLIEKYLSTKTLKQKKETKKIVDKELYDLSGFNLETLLRFDSADFKSILTEKRGFNFENTELLANLLFILGNDNFEQNTTFLSKALDLYEFIDTESKTFSLERKNRMQNIEDKLNKN